LAPYDEFTDFKIFLKSIQKYIYQSFSKGVQKYLYRERFQCVLLVQICPTTVSSPSEPEPLWSTFTLSQQSQELQQLLTVIWGGHCSCLLHSLVWWVFQAAHLKKSNIKKSQLSSWRGYCLCTVKGEKLIHIPHC